MFENERKDLVESLSRKGITDKKVLEAINRVPRHLFVPTAIRSHAYRDVALPIGFGQTISQPYTVAYMSQALKVGKDAKILEIGTGSGYQAAVLYEMGARVYTIERQQNIFVQTQKLFDELGIRVASRLGDGTIGWSEFSPYDGIIVTAGGPNIPENLKKQLGIGGRLVIPVGDRKTQTLQIITKVSDNDFSIEKTPHFAFVPLIGREGWER